MFGRRKDFIHGERAAPELIGPDASAENTPMVLVLCFEAHNIVCAGQVTFKMRLQTWRVPARTCVRVLRNGSV